MRLIVVGLCFYAISLAQDLTVIFPSNLTNGCVENNSIFWGLFYEDTIPGFFIWRPVEVKSEIYYEEPLGIWDTIYSYSNKEKSIILIDGLELDGNMPVNGKLLHNIFLKPGEKVEFRLENTEYKLVAEADSHKYIYSADYYYNYRYILEERNELSRIYKLMEISSVSLGILHEAPYIVWVGDLDYDGRLDLITSERCHYAAINGTVYITSLAQDSAYALKISVTDAIDY
jgi:hypothetical protein